jgi:RHS repeat-associated protein
MRIRETYQKWGDLSSNGQDPRRIEYAGASVDYPAKYQQSQQTLKDRYSDFEVVYKGTDNDDYVNGGGFCCDDAPSLRGGAIGNGNDNPEIYQYYYHSDHLGSSSLITNLDGEIVQHIEYVPFGEVFIEERNNTWNTPYLFNTKELDEETGMYYYGARYYDSRISLWLGVDPMWEKYPEISPYAYCLNNPINAVDPDGKLPILLIPVIKGAVGAVVDAAAQVTVSMANGQDFGEALSNIDYTSVGASFVTSAIAMPGMSTAPQ